MLGVRHLRTRPYRPQTNGKAERFIRTMLGGWAYGAIYRPTPRAQKPPPAGLHQQKQKPTPRPRGRQPRAAG